jgi:hypothetical protein
MHMSRQITPKVVITVTEPMANKIQSGIASSLRRPAKRRGPSTEEARPVGDRGDDRAGSNIGALRSGGLGRAEQRLTVEIELALQFNIGPEV